MENENKTNETVEQRELAILADFVTRPKPMARYAEQFLIAADDFTIPAHRTAWDHLMNASHDDEVALLNIVRTDLALKGGKKVDAFLDLQSVTDAHAKVRLSDFSKAAYASKVQAATLTALSNLKDCGDPASISAKVKMVIDSIPKPPSIDANEIAQMAKDSDYGKVPEIPSDLLHVPGFIDELVAYSLSVAYKPNRVLAFAGALSVLAHLAGRLFTDKRDTRTNLYVLAVGHSGIGKESPRRVNHTVMHSCSRSDTVFDQVASGEAIEEVLFRKPCALFQIDEIQKMLLALRDGRNATAINIIKFLNNLFTASGSVHTLRPKATAMDECGRMIFDPSLTVFGTGIAHGVYQALTPEIIEDGFLGRCLIFDTAFEGEANAFEGEKPALPPSVVNQAQELAARHHRIGGNCENEPSVVPYGEGVNARINEIFKTINGYKLKCNEKSEHIGTALWGRAPEKVSKLALIYAISENYVEPVISSAAVEWAWELTELLVRRMLQRVDIWMTFGKIDEYARQVMEFLVANGGSVTRREVSRHCHAIANAIVEVEQVLEDRGLIQVTHLARNSFKYTLVRDK